MYTESGKHSDKTSNKVRYSDKDNMLSSISGRNTNISGNKEAFKETAAYVTN